MNTGDLVLIQREIGLVLELSSAGLWRIFHPNTGKILRYSDLLSFTLISGRGEG
jgi:hypothetical protein